MKHDLDPYYSRHDDREPGMGVITSLSLVVIGMAMGMVMLMLARSCDREPMPKPGHAQAACASCHNRQAALVQYFTRAGSQSPQEMADAVNRTRNGRLLAAIAVVETGGNPQTRRSGYKKRHDGAFQVASKHWGKVPNDAAGQALQAEAILIELTETMPVRTALNYYGGDKTHRKYADMILAELREVP